MNRNKDYNREHAREVLKKANIDWQSFNKDNHWKIGKIDFYPTTLRWIDTDTELSSEGVFQLVEHLRTNYPMQTYTPRTGIMYELSVEEMFKIAKKVKPLNLEKVCETLHKEIYG